MTFGAVLTPQGDGSYVVRPSKPTMWMTVSQVATHFGVSRSSVRRWIAEGVLPEDQIERAGLRKWRISSSALAVLKDRFSRIGA